METSASQYRHSSCLLKAVCPPINTASFISPFFSPHFISHGTRARLLLGKKEKSLASLSSVLWDARCGYARAQNGKHGYTLHCGPPTHPDHKTSVEVERAVNVDLYYTSQNSPITITLSSFLLQMTIHIHIQKVSNSKQEFPLRLSPQVSGEGCLKRFRAVGKPQSA